MNCDDAFDRMTTPGGQRDAGLSAHLARCSRCRAMAETLGPALDLFTSPETQTFRDPALAVGIAVESAAQLATRSRTRSARSSRPRFRLAGWLAAAAAGAACCALVLKLSPAPAAGPLETVRCPRRSPEAMQWMNENALSVATACIACHPATEQPQPAARSRPEDCCSRGSFAETTASCPPRCLISVEPNKARG